MADVYHNDNSSNGDYPESVVLKSSAKPSLILEPLTQDNKPLEELNIGTISCHH